MNTTPAPRRASSREDVAVTPSGSSTPGRYVPFSRRRGHGGCEDRRAGPQGDRVRGSHQRRHRRAPRTGANYRHSVAHLVEPMATAMGRRCPSPYTVESARQRHCLDADSPPPPRAPLGHEVVLVPVKGFRQAKRRLGGSMSDEKRVQLVRSMAERVLAACAPLQVAVVCDDPEVAEWATALGASVMWEPGQGLNGAVAAGVEQLETAGVAWVIVAHGDLPRARDLGALAPFAGITLGARPQGRRDQRSPAPGGVRLPLRLRPRFVPRPPRRGSPDRTAGPGAPDTRVGLRRGLAGRCRRTHRMTDRATPPGIVPVNDLPARGAPSRDLPAPASALAIGAHPDDIEFGCGATLAKWAAAGTVLHHLVLTDGSKGSWDPRPGRIDAHSLAQGGATRAPPPLSAAVTSPSSVGPTVSSAMTPPPSGRSPDCCGCSAPMSCSPTTRGAATASIPTTAHAGFIVTDVDRRRTRSPLLRRPGSPAPPPVGARCYGRPTSRTTSKTSPNSCRRRSRRSWLMRASCRAPWASTGLPRASSVPSPSGCATSSATTGRWPDLPYGESFHLMTDI